MKEVITRKPKEKNIIKLKKYLRKHGRKEDFRVNSKRK